MKNQDPCASPRRLAGRTAAGLALSFALLAAGCGDSDEGAASTTNQSSGADVTSGSEPSGGMANMAPVDLPDDCAANSASGFIRTDDGESPADTEGDAATAPDDTETGGADTSEMSDMSDTSEGSPHSSDDMGEMSDMGSDHMSDDMGDMSDMEGMDDMEGMNMGDASAIPARDVANAELSSGSFELLDTRPQGYDEAGGTADMARSDAGTTVTINLEGLPPCEQFISHLHEDSCANNGGDHFKFDADGSDFPPNEVHLQFASDSTGAGFMTAENDMTAGDDAVAIVVHPLGLLENKIMCADFSAAS